MKDIKQTSYGNAEVFRFENTKVTVGTMPDGSYYIEFKVASSDLEPRAVHRVEKGKVVVTAIKLSKEAAISVATGLEERFEKDCII